MVRTARAFVLSSLAVLATACASTAPAPPVSDPPATPTTPSPLGQCDPAPAQTLVGQKATPENVELARRRAGADMARVIPPDTAVTMEYREGRLNIYTDATNTITRIACG